MKPLQPNERAALKTLLDRGTHRMLASVAERLHKTYPLNIEIEDYSESGLTATVTWSGVKPAEEQVHGQEFAVSNR